MSARLADTLDDLAEAPSVLRAALVAAGDTRTGDHAGRKGRLTFAMSRVLGNPCRLFYGETVFWIGRG